MASDQTPGTPHGFIIYRGDYSDDAQWERYMAYLKHQTRFGYEGEDDLQTYNLFDWKVVWLESGEEEIGSNSYQYRACLCVEESCLMCLDSFMEKKSLDKDDDLTLFDARGATFGILVSRYAHEGWTMVGMSVLMPWVSDTIIMQEEGGGWQAISVPEGDVSLGP